MSFQYNWQYTGKIKFVDDLIRTADLYYRKRLLYKRVTTTGHLLVTKLYRHLVRKNWWKEANLFETNSIVDLTDLSLTLKTFPFLLQCPPTGQVDPKDHLSPIKKKCRALWRGGITRCNISPTSNFGFMNVMGKISQPLSCYYSLWQS